MTAIVYQENWHIEPTEIKRGSLEDCLAYVQVENLYERHGDDGLRVSSVEAYPLCFCWVELEAAQ